ncbi:MAG: hypothetical protein QM642_04635 [Edaphocola sp.]
MKIVFFSLAMSAACCSVAQNQSRLYEVYFSKPDRMKPDEEHGGYSFDVGDSLKVYMSDDGYYKLMLKNGTVVEEGDTDEGDNSFARHGNWSSYYRNGKLKENGNYYLDKPYGHWSFYDESGQPASEMEIVPIVAEDGNTAYCKAGREVLYFPNGKIKEERYHKAEPYDAQERVKVEDPETGKEVWKTVKVKAYKPKPFGTWVVYAADGTVEKREDKK